jgi:hypothetical protein
MSQKYDSGGKRIVSVPFSALGSLPGLLFEFTQVADPGEDAVLIWDDSANEFILQPLDDFIQDQTGLFHGYVDASVAAEVLPTGWTVTNPATGNYVITHNLNLSAATDLHVVVTPIEAENTSVRPNIIDLTVDSFEVMMDNDVGDANYGFFFIAVRTPS